MSTRKAGRSVGLCRGAFIWAATAVFIAGMSPPAHGERVRLVLHPAADTTRHAWIIGSGLLASGSDSVSCRGRLLRRSTDYHLNFLTGELTLAPEITCDSILVSVFQLPEWLQAPAGNPVPQGKRLLRLDSLPVAPTPPAGSSPQRLTLSGNKSFTMTVGRSGEGVFSQGMDVDFDAFAGGGLHLRGAISDRGGRVNNLGGGTTPLSELDKYFFEIEGSRFLARGGDIHTPKGELPIKRIKGISAVYQTENHRLAADLGRPPGRFISRKIAGADGRQGPYQIVNDDGLPTGVVAGTEKIYLDGRLLESGADKEYLVDYPSGRITFSPRVLITARSRIEVDCEAVATVYDQAIYDVMGSAGILGRRLTLGLGARRETDEKDRLRYGSLSAQDIDILRNAGDSTAQAFTSGAVATPGGNYVSTIDSMGNRYYRFVGSGNGEYNVTFSMVGERRGEYRYLGDGVFEYVGIGQGSYLPVNYLTLPGSQDKIQAALAAIFAAGGEARLLYEGNIVDHNLFSSRDDDDNFTSRAAGEVTFDRGWLKSSGDFHFRQTGFTALSRVEEADYTRLWALPDTAVQRDEMRLQEAIEAAIPSGRLTAGWGYLNYKDRLKAHRLAVAGRFLDSLPITPRFEYRSAGSSGWSGRSGSGLFERQTVGVSIKTPQAIGFDLDYTRELTKNLYGPTPAVEKFSEYRGTVFFRRSSVAVSRRIDFTGTDVGFKGPRSDKLVLSLEEALGRLTVSFSGTYLHLKRLDSDRADRDERLFSAGFHYAPTGGWVTVQADYRQNRRDVRTSGYRYVHVQSGDGEYRYEDGRYLPDPDGDYIRIREETGSQTSVSAGQKSHTIMLYPGRIGASGTVRALLAQTAFRLRTEVIEELPGANGRPWSWIIPWVSRSGVEYTTRNRRESYSAMMLPRLNYYLVNLTYSSGREEQSFGAPYTRDRKQYDVEIKNQISPSVRHTLQWHHKRTGEQGYGLTALRMTADEYQVGVIVSQGSLQFLPGISYLRFSDRLSGGAGRGFVVNQQVIVRRPGQGEIRSEVELRSLTRERPFSQPEFLVTEGRRFGRSARVSLATDYSLKKTWRISVNVTDQIFTGRSAEFMGRGELVAQF